MVEPFGQMPDGDPAYRIILRNDALKVAVLTYGAVLQSIESRDRYGITANVVLGLSNLSEYIAHSPHFGAVPGRFAGRIAGGRFTLDGLAYQLPQNNGRNAMHGGPFGFGKRNWSLGDYNAQEVMLKLISPDGEGGYPGSLELTLQYSLNGPNLRLIYSARTTRSTIINLTNHSYFNLAGEGSGTVLDHELMIDASHFLPLDRNSIPTGELRSVKNTAFDFTAPRVLGAHIRDDDAQILAARGYDHTFLLNGEGFRRAACLTHRASGRRLTVTTTEPALQLYTANSLTGSLVGPSRRAYRQGDAVCLEAQHVPDSPNQGGFPTTVLRPGTTYRATTEFSFSCL